MSLIAGTSRVEWRDSTLSRNQETIQRERDTMRLFASWWRRFGRPSDLSWAKAHRDAADRLKQEAGR